MPQRLAMASVFAVAMLMVTGCMRLNMAIDLLENNQASAQVDMAFQDEAVRALGYEPDDLWAEAERDLSAQLPLGATIERYPEPGWTGSRIHIPASPFSGLGAFQEAGISDIEVTRQGDYYVFSSVSGLADDVEGFATEIPAGAGEMDLTLTLTCPGDVVESNGVITGNQVVWDLTQFNSTEPQTARCVAVGAGGSGVGGSGDASTPGAHQYTGAARWWPAVLLGVLTLGVFGALAYFLRRRSHVERDTASNFDHVGDWGRVDAESPLETDLPTQTYVAPREGTDPNHGNY